MSSKEKTPKLPHVKLARKMTCAAALALVMTERARFRTEQIKLEPGSPAYTRWSGLKALQTTLQGSPRETPIQDICKLIPEEFLATPRSRAARNADMHP